MKINKSLRYRQKGIALILALLAVVILSVLGFGLVAIANSHAKALSNSNASQKAYYMAQLGLEQAMAALSTNENWAVDAPKIIDLGSEGKVQISVWPHPGNSKSSYKIWKVESVGDFQGFTRKTVAWLDMELFVTYSYYTYFENPTIYMVDGEKYTGKIHSNSFLSVSGKPEFSSRVTSSNLTESEIKQLIKDNNPTWSTSTINTNYNKYYSHYCDAFFVDNNYNVGGQILNDPKYFYHPKNNNYTESVPVALDNSADFSFAGREPVTYLPEMVDVPAYKNHDVKIKYFQGEMHVRFQNTGGPRDDVGKIQIFFDPSENDKAFFPNGNLSAQPDSSKLGQEGYGKDGTGLPDYMPEGGTNLLISGPRWVNTYDETTPTTRLKNYSGNNIGNKKMWLVEYAADNITIFCDYFHQGGTEYIPTSGTYEGELMTKWHNRYDYLFNLETWSGGNYSYVDGDLYGDLVIQPGVFKGKATIVSSDDMAIRGSVLYDDADRDVLGLIARDKIVIQTRIQDRDKNCPVIAAHTPDVPVSERPNMQIDAALLSVAGSLSVYNITSQSAAINGKQGTLKLNGSLSQFCSNATAFKLVDTANGNVYNTGYLLHTVYDEKLTKNPPPNYPATGKIKIMARWDSGAIDGCEAGDFQ